MRVRLVSTIDHVSNVAAVLGGLGMVAILSFTMNEIVFRSLIGHGFRFSWEFSGFAMAASFFLPAGYTLRHGTHVRTSALHGLLRPGPLLFVDRLCCLIGMTVIGYATLAMANSMISSYSLGEHSWSGTGTPLWVPKAIITFGLLVFAMQCLAEALRSAEERSAIANNSVPQSEGL